MTTVDRAVRQVQGISAQRDAWVEVRYEVNQEHSVGHAYLATGNPKLRPALDQASRSLEAAFAELVAYGEPDDAAQARRLQARHAPQPPAAAADAGRGRRRGPAHGNDTAELLQHADVAMYAAKQTHSGFMVYDPTVDQHSPRRLALLGAEALVRWQHPDHGLLGPGEFIPLAERTGLIHPLTRCLLDPGFPDQVAARLDAWKVPAGSLVLEVTESAVMADPARALDVLGRLHALGVRLAVDDFGTGHNLGLRVVAEGVETQDAWERLEALGCDTAQGYYLGRPMPAADLEHWLERPADLSRRDQG